MSSRRSVFAAPSTAVLSGALFLFGTRSETLRGVGGPGRDERWAMIDVHATALTGIVLIVVIIGAFVTGILFYVGWRMYKRSQGVDTTLAYRYIPPE